MANPTVECVCKFCGITFQRDKYMVGRGKETFCSCECAGKYKASLDGGRPFHRGEDWTGKVINGIEVLELYSKTPMGPNGERRHTMWKLKCKCGAIFTTPKISIVSGKQKSCTACKNPTGKLNQNWKGVGGIPKTYINNIQRGNAKKGRVVNLNWEYMWELLIKQDFKCAISGVPIGFAGGSRSKQRRNWTASVDRIDSALGYTNDNVQWVHKHINKMKQDFTQEQFVQFCICVSEYQNILGDVNGSTTGRAAEGNLGKEIQI